MYAMVDARARRSAHTGPSADRRRRTEVHELVTTGDRVVCRLLPALAALVAVASSPTGRALAEPNLLAFDRFITQSQPVCQFGRAPDCVNLAWRFADADGDQGLSVAELQAVRQDVEAWAIWRQDDLAAHERSGIALGLWLIDAIGVDYFHAAYDADHDGRISRAELLADVRLDDRPIGDVLLDPAAVDHRAIGRRLGLPPRLMDQLPLERFAPL